ncbi:MAG TPA: PAS domain-containing protein, partial [Candidatus Angelobacter sp.]|nr:PAS domain-containing protein [Candidatus Angelobacter sp.]
MNRAAHSRYKPTTASWLLFFAVLFALQVSAPIIFNQRELRFTYSGVLFAAFLWGTARLYRHICQQEQAEAALRDEADNLRLILESAGQGIYGIDLNGNFTFCNGAALKLLGYKAAEDLVGRKMHPHIHHTRPDGSPYPECECPVHAVLGNGKAFHSVDEVYWRPEGTSFPIECWAFPQRKGLEIVG